MYTSGVVSGIEPVVLDVADDADDFPPLPGSPTLIRSPIGFGPGPERAAPPTG
jgi:hypothetical protein